MSIIINITEETPILRPIPLLYSDWREVPWDSKRWPNFSPGESRLFCPMTGEFYFDKQAFDCLQLARNIVGEKFIITSGHRSPVYNAIVGGKPLSQHKKVAFDISILNHKFPVKVYQALRDAGFTGFGFYQTFIHADTGWPRQWFSKRGKILWNSLGIY